MNVSDSWNLPLNLFAIMNKMTGSNVLPLAEFGYNDAFQESTKCLHSSPIRVSITIDENIRDKVLENSFDWKLGLLLL